MKLWLRFGIYGENSVYDFMNSKEIYYPEYPAFLLNFTIFHFPYRAEIRSPDLTTGAYCYRVNNATDAAKYGALYNWYAVITGKLAPKGWRVPSDADWTALEKHLIANGYNWDDTRTGNKIAKSMCAKTDWITSSNAGGPGNDPAKNNRSGFSAIPGGYRGSNGFDSHSNSGFFWSVTESGASGTSYRDLSYYIEYLRRGDCNKQNGLSVRLVRD